MTYARFRFMIAALLVLAGFSLLSVSPVVAQTPSVVADLNDGSASSFPAEFVQIDDAGTPTLIFAATGNNASGSNIGRELWKTDGTSAGTVLVRDISAGSNSSNPSDLVVLGNTVFFSCTTGTAGRELCQSDGTQAGTGVLKDINPGSNGSRVTGLTVVGDQLFFFADNGTTGLELWVSDGTEIGTQLVQDIYPGPTPLNRARSGFNISLRDRFAGTDDTFFFMANDGTTGLELWASDGTSSGTRNVRDIEPGDQGPQQLRQFTTLGNLLVFESQVGFGEREVWVSDGTELGTNPADGVVGGVNGSGPEAITNVGDQVYFFAFYEIGNDFFGGLYTYSVAGGVQRIVDDIFPGSGDASIAAFGSNRALLDVRNNATSTSETWITDGTGAGTSKIADVQPDFERVNASATGLQGDMTPVQVEANLYFQGDTSADGAELWRTDGTSLGTEQVQNFGAGTADADLTDLAVLNGNQLLFGAVDGATGNELWRVEEPPSVFLTDPLSDQRAVIGETQTYLLENAFSTPPGATVMYSVSSADGSIATARFAPELAQLIVEAVGLGTTTITYQAEVNGQAVEDSFQLEVVEPFPDFTMEALIGEPSEVCSDPTNVNTCDPLSPFVSGLTPRADTLDLAAGETALVRYIFTNASTEDLFDVQIGDDQDGLLASAPTLVSGDSLVVDQFVDAPETFGVDPRIVSGTATDDQGLKSTKRDVIGIDVERPFLGLEVRTAKAADFCTDITDPSTCDSVPDRASAFLLRDDTLRTYARDTVLVQFFAQNEGSVPFDLTELTSTQLGSVLPSDPSTLAPSDSLVVNRITEAPISIGITGEVGEARVQDAGGNEAIERDPYGFIVEPPVARFDARLQAASEVCSDVTDVSTCGVVGNPRDTVDVAPGQPVLVQYSLQNLGNVPFRAATVTNSLFGPVVTDTSVYVPSTGNDSLVINRLYDAPQGAGLTEFITRATVKDAGGNAGNVGPEETDVLAFSISDPIVRLDVRLRKAEEVCTDLTDPQTCGLIGTPRNTIEVNATEPVHARYVIRNFTEPSTITQVTLVGDVEGAVLQDEPVSIAPGDSLIIKRIFPAPSEAKQTSSVVSLVATDSGGNAASEAEVMVYDVPAPGLVFNARVARAADFCTDPTDASTCSSSFSNLNPNTVPIGTGEHAYVRYILDIPFNAPDITEVTLTDSYVGSILSAEPVNFGPQDSLIVKRIYAAPEVPGIQRFTTQATVADAGGNQVSISRQYGYNVEPVGFQFDVRVDRASNACSDVTDVSTCFNISPQLPDTVEALSPGTPYLVRYVVQNLGSYTVLENITITDENQGTVTQTSNAGLGSSDSLGINRIYTATGTAGIDPVRVSAVIGDAFGNTSTLDIAYGLQGTGPQFRPVILLGPASVFCSDPNDLSTCSRARLKRMQANPELAQKALAKNGIEREAVLYSFINTGTETFTRHTVNDNVSGNVLADEAISVAPLDSIEFFRIYDEVAAIGDQRTVTWTAATADGDVLTNGSASEPLPVELASFGAAVAGREVTLEWITASEENNAGFEVQQFDRETESWTRLTFVDGAGTTNEPKTYRYPVAGLEPDVHQFRLRQIDVSGRFALSQPIEATVMIDGPFRLSDIAPHPVRGTGDLSLTVREPQAVRAEIYDLLGRRVASVLDADLTAGKQHPMTLDASRLSSGVYFLRVIGETFATTQRVTVVR